MHWSIREGQGRDSIWLVVARMNGSVRAGISSQRYHTVDSWGRELRQINCPFTCWQIGQLLPVISYPGQPLLSCQGQPLVFLRLTPKQSTHNTTAHMPKTLTVKHAKWKQHIQQQKMVQWVPLYTVKSDSLIMTVASGLNVTKHAETSNS